MNKDQRLPTTRASYFHFEKGWPRISQRLVKGQQLHNLSNGRNILLDKAEVEFTSELYRRFGRKALPVYHNGTWWSPTMVGTITGKRAQYINAEARNGKLYGSWVGNRRYINHDSLDSYAPGATRRFLRSLNLDWCLDH